VNQTADHGFRTCSVDKRCCSSNRHSGIRGERSLFLSSKAQLDRALKLLLDASIHFELRGNTACIGAWGVWENISVPITPLFHGAPSYTQVVGSKCSPVTILLVPFKGLLSRPLRRRPLIALVLLAEGHKFPLVAMLAPRIFLLRLLRVRCLTRRARHLMICAINFL
jgi:hypothetical protein